MKKTNNLSVALLNRNPCEEKSLCKKLDEIDRMKNKILRESSAKMTNFAIQHLYIMKYYDAKNGEQCRPPLKVAKESVCSLPRLTTGERKPQSRRMFNKSSSLPERFERRDCATAWPRRHRSLSDPKSPPLSEVNLAGEKGSVAVDNHKSQGEPNSDRTDHLKSVQVSKPKSGRSLSEVAPPKSLMLDGPSAQPQNTSRRSHAWAEKENEENQSKVNCSDSALKQKYSRSLSQCVAPSKLSLIQSQEGSLPATDEGSQKEREEGTDARKGSAIQTEGVKERRQLQRRITVAGETPSISREFCRWQQTVKLVKDLPKSEQAEIFRGACFFRMALPPRYVSPQKHDKRAGRQRKISTITDPCRQELSPSTLTARFSPLY